MSISIDRRHFLVSAAAGIAGAAFLAQGGAAGARPPAPFRLSDAQWRNRLSA